MNNPFAETFSEFPVSRCWLPRKFIPRRIESHRITRIAAMVGLATATALASAVNESVAASDSAVIERGDRWAPLDFKKDPVPGSALDFSGMNFQDAPAGKHGWLKNVNGHFEFEGLPGVQQRFYGVNLCFSANFPEHDMADLLVARLARCGYNSVRIHHHDGAWAAAQAGRTVEQSNSQTVSPSPAPNVEPSDRQTVRPSDLQTDDDIDRLDYLLARCYEAGLYVTTDLYVSRPVSWRDIGIDQDGVMDKWLYKTYVGIHDGAFADWCRWARSFLEHVNPYTGRANKDEPGMPLVSLVNEGRLLNGWSKKADDPVVQVAWHEFGGEGDIPSGNQKDPADTPFNRFDEWVNRRIWERCSSFVRALGCRALLTNDNNGRWHGEGEGLAPFYDYVDSHFYVDHPKWESVPYRFPLLCAQKNPIRAKLPEILYRSYAKGHSKPYTLTEWNFCVPGRYRSMSGLLTGVVCAEQEWDGLWRFAYAHSRDTIPDGQFGQGNSYFYDCVSDPVISAGDRAAVCLFLRGDARGNPDIRIDHERGAMSVATPLTCGGFAESGRIDAGVLSFEIVESRAKFAKSAKSSAVETSRTSRTLREENAPPPTALWASSRDGAPLSTSSRILLVHLTDVQREGAKFADNTFTAMLKRGDAPLVESGAAEVELRLSGGDSGAQPPSFVVFSLDAAGNRTAEIPASFADGTLRFTVSTIAPDGTGRIYYEIVLVSPPGRIDYIFVSRGTGVKSIETVGDPRPGMQTYPSDHFPVVSVLELPQAETDTK